MNTHARCATIFLLLLSLSFAGNVSAAGGIFLKLTNSNGQTIDGESTDAQHPKEIDVFSFSFGVSNPGTVIGGGGTGAGKPNFSEITISKSLDKASPMLYLAVAQNTHLSQAILTVTKSGTTGKDIDYYRITLTNPVVTSIQTSGSAGGQPTESLTLAFEKIQWDYVPQNPDGSLGTVVTATWNLLANSAQ